MITASPLRESLPYRDCVGAAVFNGQGKVFIGRRKSDRFAEDESQWQAPWQMPQGGIDNSEQPLPAALRELYEETSIRSVRLVAEAPDWISYDLPDAALGIALKGKYRGQRQRWFAFAFLGEETEVDVLSPGGGRFRAEFDTWRWEDLNKIPDLIVPFKRDAYRKIVAAFADVPAQFGR